MSRGQGYSFGRGLGVVGFVTACAVGAGIGGYAGSTEPEPAPITVTTAPAWADGCTTDADCLAMEEALNAAGLYLTGGGEVSTSPPEQQWEDADLYPLPWAPVSPELAEAFAEGDDTPPENAATRQWEACIIQWHTSDVYTVECPDGYVTTNG
jgi:hypothetical protein